MSLLSSQQNTMTVDYQREPSSEKDTKTLWENSNIFSTVTSGTTDDTSTSNDLQRELNIKTEKDSEMLLENSDICSTVTSETADDTASDTQGSFDENMQKFYR